MNFYEMTHAHALNYFLALPQLIQEIFADTTDVCEVVSPLPHDLRIVRLVFVQSASRVSGLVCIPLTPLQRHCARPSPYCLPVKITQRYPIKN